jgi:hypothetical protein
MRKGLNEGPIKPIMLGATVWWFSAAPFWLKGGSE